MQSHEDKDAMFTKEQRDKFLETLEDRAKTMQRKALSEIAGGLPDEPILAQWDHAGMRVIVRPDDSQGILRISIGGGSKLPVNLNYCTIRGDVDACARLLEQALEALRTAS